ncbi:MAG: UvrD-helicase domain-containing protein [Bacteroidales bacterium]|nr:UvrD-helicase domain-containing protein [Bacteroidales bacterium]
MNANAAFRVYQASAGSGKTYTLVKEYLKLCLKSEAHVNNFKTILAMTFTNAAANEMKERIVSDLNNIINSTEAKGIEADLTHELEIDDAQLKHNAQLLLQSIIHDYSSFCVCTIDAFVQKLSRSFAHDLGLSSQYMVSIDGKEMSNAVVESLGSQISDDNDFLAKIVTDFCKNQFDSDHSSNLEEKLGSFVVKLMTEKAYQRDENNNIHNLEQYEETLDFLNKKTEIFETKIKKYVSDYKAIEAKYQLTDADCYQGVKGVASFIRKLAKKEYDLPKSYYDTVVETGKWYSAAGQKRFGKAELETIRDEFLAILVPLKETITSDYPAYLFYSSQRKLLCMYALRAKIREEFQKISDEDEIVHISEFNKLINNVLGDYSVPFIYERVGETYRHVFVDEFQDTSVMQWQNLLPLIDNGLSTDSMSMIVGDGKQSIYRFRSGEVGQLVSLPEIFALPDDERQKYFEQYQDNLKAHFGFTQLGTNRRSFQNIIKFNNDFFEKTYTKLSAEHQRVYVDQCNKYGKKVSVFQETSKPEEGFVQMQLYDPKDKDFCNVAIENLINELLEKGYDYGDIAILTRKAAFGSSIANYLNSKNIPVVSHDSILLKSSDKVRLLVNTLRYFIEKSNTAVVANEIYLWHLVNDKDFSGNVSGMFNQVNAIARGETDLETVLGIGDPGLLSGVMAKATCLYDLCASLVRIFGFDAIDDAFLNSFMEEVFKWQNGVRESIIDFLDFWGKKQNILSIESVGTNAVNIMTIHKSKGLQFPVVIYPKAIVDLDERIQGNSNSEEVWVKPEDLGFEAIPNLEKVLLSLDKKVKLMGEKAIAISENDDNGNRLDNLNLLYVAFTRAIQRLYVLAEDNDSQNLIKDYMQFDPLPEGMKLMEDGKLLQFGNPDFDKPKESEKKHDDVVTFGKTDDDLASCDWFSKIDVDSDPTMLWMSPDDKLSPSEWGELVHEMLSKIATADDIDRALQPYILEGVIDEETFMMLKDKMMQMMADPIVGKAFAKEARVKNECEILSDGKILRPDRYAELPDEIILLDYKTGKKDPKHHRQLKDYIVALREMVQKDIHAYLVYLAEPIEVEEVVMDTLF